MTCKRTDFSTLLEIIEIRPILLTLQTRKLSPGKIKGFGNLTHQLSVDNAWNPDFLSPLLLWFGNTVSLFCCLSKLALRKGHHNFGLGANINDWWVFNYFSLGPNNEILLLTAINWERSDILRKHEDFFFSLSNWLPCSFTLLVSTFPLFWLFKWKKAWSLLQY